MAHEDERLLWLENNLVQLAELGQTLNRLSLRLGQLSRRFEFVRPTTGEANNDIAECRAVIQNIARSALDLDDFDLKKFHPVVRDMFLELSTIRNNGGRNGNHDN